MTLPWFTGPMLDTADALEDTTITSSEFGSIVSSLSGILIWAFGLSMLIGMIKKTYG